MVSAVIIFSAIKKSENVSRRKHSIADEFVNWYLPFSDPYIQASNGG